MAKCGFHQFRVVVMYTSALAVILGVIFALADYLGFVEWSVGGNDWLARTWNFIVTPIGAVMFVGLIAVFVLTTLLVDINLQRRRVREWKRKKDILAATRRAIRTAASVAGRPTAAPYPSIDIRLLPEHCNRAAPITHIPRLDLKINNRGDFAITDVRMRATRYSLQYKTVEPPVVDRLEDGNLKLIKHGVTELVIENFGKLGSDSLKIRRVREKTQSNARNIVAMPGLSFIKPPSPGEPGGHGGAPLPPRPAITDYYGLRFTFVDEGTQKRYATYRIVSCEEPYLLPLDNPKVGVGGSGGSEEWFLTPAQIIMKHQRVLYSGSPEEEYMTTRPLS